MHRAAAIGLEHVAFHRAKRIVVELRQPVIGAAIAGEYPVLAEHIVQCTAMPVIPVRGFQPLGHRVARAVHPQFAIGAVVAVERLEHRGAPRPVHDLGGAAGELPGYRRIHVTRCVGIAEQPPGQRDRSGARQRLEQGRQAAVAHMDVDEFIHVQRQDPVGLFHQPVFRGRLECRELDAPLVIGAIIAQMNQHAHLGQPIQHLVGAVLAVI